MTAWGASCADVRPQTDRLDMAAKTGRQGVRYKSEGVRKVKRKAVVHAGLLKRAVVADAVDTAVADVEPTRPIRVDDQAGDGRSHPGKCGVCMHVAAKVSVDSMQDLGDPLWADQGGACPED